MSDFNNFFAKKLDEEGQFPRKEKNWRTLSKRLDAFDTGLQHQVGNTQTYLRYWQAAAASAVLVAGWLTWKVVCVQNENAGLRQEVAVLQKKNEDAAALKGAQEHTDSGNQEKTDPANLVNFSGRSLSALGYPKEDKSDFSASAADKTIQHKEANFNRPITWAANSSNPDFLDEKQSLSKQPTANNSPPIQADDLANSKNGSNQQAASTLSKLPTNALDKIILAPQTRVVLLPVLNKDFAATADAQNIIKPLRPDSRFRAGVQLLAGVPQPQEEGVSLITGAGVTAEYNIWKGFWVTASADWLHFDVSTNTFHQKFHPSQDPPPPPHIGPPWFKEKLVEVESAQRQQHFGMGLRYAFPVRFWVRPSIRVAHTWMRISPEQIILKYQNPGWPGWPPPPPRYKVRESDTQIIDNTWRFGFGLERETPNWVFGLWADYSKNFTTNTPSFDMLLFRGGVQYRFN